MAEVSEKKSTTAKKPTAAKVAPKASAEAKTAKTTTKSSTAKIVRKKPVVTVSDEKRPYRKARQGYVVSNKMDKTIVVEIEQRTKHPLYGKVVKKFKKFKAHDEENTAGIGDLVRIVETRPLSATKRWRLADIIERSK